MNHSLIKRVSKILIFSALVSVVGVYAVAEIQDRLERA